MKSAQNIVSHLRAQPSMRKISSLHCINKAMLLLPPGIQNRVRFSYIKNNVLFFVLNHPGAKMEFDNILKSIKKPLKEMLMICDSTLAISDIKAFVTHKPPTPEPRVSKTSKETYTERSQAEFENHFEEKKLHELFEEIRKIIDATNA